CNPADTGVVILNLTNQFGCDSVHTITTTLLSSSFSIDNVTICKGESYFAGGSNQIGSGVYNDTLIAANGCDSIIVTELHVVEFIVVGFSELDTVKLGNSTELEAYSDSIITTYTWTPSNGLDCDDCANPIATPTVSTDYMITAFDQYGCSDSSLVLVVVVSDTSFTPDSDTIPLCRTAFYIPNAFSPNGDGNNEVFYVYGKGVRQMHLKIFNRWGELVFETDNLNNGWDGTYKGELQTAGVYVYHVKAVFCDGSTITPHEYKKGSVTLFR